MGIIVRERAQEAGLRDQQRRGSFGMELMEPEPQLPVGWEKCLDMKSGLIYFKDWNSGTQTYRDPRQTQKLAASTQRIGLLSISLSHDTEKLTSSANILSSKTVNNADATAAVLGGVSAKKFKRKMAQDSRNRLRSVTRLPWALSVSQTCTTADDDSHSDRENSLSMDYQDNDQSLELSLNPPGTSTSRGATTSTGQDDSVCTVEKVRSALERSQWLNRPNLKRLVPGKITSNTLSTSLSLLSSRPSSSRESNSPCPQSDSSSKASSPSTSQGSGSECFTSPSVMSYQGDDEEVQQPREYRESGLRKSQLLSGGLSMSLPGAAGGEVMVAVGCKSCLMYVMLSKQHPSCPNCGNTDVLLALPAPPLPKRQRMSVDDSPILSWSTA